MAVLSNMLGDLGFANIDHAGDSVVAMDMLGDRGSRLVIAGLHVQPTNGLQFLRRVRSTEPVRRVQLSSLRNP
jgi:CheY-like chemotaxis protein